MKLLLYSKPYTGVRGLLDYLYKTRSACVLFEDYEQKYFLKFKLS